MRTVTRISAVTAMVAGLCAAAPQALSAGAASSKPVVVVSGLNNPRQIVLVGNDELLIAEAGKGGTIKTTGPDGEPTFIGATGSISVVYLPQYARHTRPTRVVRGLMSGAGPDGSFAVGSDGVAARTPHGRIFIQETYAPPGVLPTSLKRQNGRLLAAARPYHSVHSISNITRYEKVHDPDHMGFDSDPYAVIARKTDLLIADAAGNDVLRRSSDGRLHVFHVFKNVKTGPCAHQADPGPKFPGCNFVPTSLTTDRAGHVYVGGLSSLTPNQGQVVKLSADGKHVLRVYHGFSGVSGLAVSPKGVLYVSELFGTEQHAPNPQIQGIVTRISPSGHRSERDVPFPAGLAVSSTGTLYVVAWSVSAENGLAGPGTSGQVWRMNW
jgi:hypothetical protein